MKKLLTSSLLLILLSLSGNAHAATVYCKNCSNNIIQALERVTNLDQLSSLMKQLQEEVQQTQQQIAMVQNLIQNTKQLGPNLIDELKGQLTQLASLTSQLKTQRGDITSLGEIYTSLFPEQALLGDLAEASTAEAIEAANQQYQEHWDKWSASVDQATQATFQLSGQQLENLQKNPEHFQAYLDELLSSPEGQMQAMMAGNQLAAVQIQEAMQLRELLATHIQSTLAKDAKAEKESQMKEELWRETTKNHNLTGLHPKNDPF